MTKRKMHTFLLVAVLILTMSIPGMAATIPNVGTERAFSAELPNKNQNVYFTTRTKQSDYAIGYIYMSSKTSKCNGINAWICNSTYNRCTSIKYCSTLKTKYALNYTKNYGKGAAVRLGIEDYDNTLIGNHSVKGYVNYN